jgi:isopenicillin-N epimerase
VVGTRDPSPFLAAPFAIELMREFGGNDGFEAVYRHNHGLARWAGSYLADRWGTAFMTPDELLGSMVSVRLPTGLGTDPLRVQEALDRAGIEVPVLAGSDGISARVSAQVYCGREDIEQLADTVSGLAGWHRPGARPSGPRP